MLIDAKTIEGFKIQATDGAIGEVHDILFDDVEWTVRYFVVNTGSWFNRGQVLLSPESVSEIDRDGRSLVVALKRQQVKDSPDVSSDLPVSRQEEERLRSYYAWPVYWGGTGLGDGLGGAISPAVLPSAAAVWTLRASDRADGAEVPPPPARESEPPGDPHLHSTREIRGYGIEAMDGEIGHVEDLLVEDGHWAVHQLVVDTKNWWPGRKVAVSTYLIRDVRWSDREVSVNISRDELKQSPEAASLHAG
ncbi:MAG: PRC-barrel domain containing protein [Rariglobus sp.]|jgi:hypothetical protein|nr:PRC-barrel domain containing protein [Rariglobus sp.]